MGTSFFRPVSASRPRWGVLLASGGACWDQPERPYSARRGDARGWSPKTPARRGWQNAVVRKGVHSVALGPWAGWAAQRCLRSAGTRCSDTFLPRHLGLLVWPTPDNASSPRPCIVHSQLAQSLERRSRHTTDAPIKGCGRPRVQAEWLILRLRNEFDRPRSAILAPWHTGVAWPGRLGPDSCVLSLALSRLLACAASITVLSYRHVACRSAMHSVPVHYTNDQYQVMMASSAVGVLLTALARRVPPQVRGRHTIDCPPILTSVDSIVVRAPRWYSSSCVLSRPAFV